MQFETKLTSGGAQRERTSWLEESHLAKQSFYQNNFPSQTPTFSSSQPSSPIPQFFIQPWNQSLVAFGRPAVPLSRLTSANLDHKASKFQDDKMKTMKTVKKLQVHQKHMIEALLKYIILIFNISVSGPSIKFIV